MAEEKKYLYKDKEVCLVCLFENFALIKYINRHIFSEMFEWINPKDLKELEVINENY